MPLAVYKIIHIFALTMIVMAIGGFTMHSLNGGTKDGNAARKFGAAVHGVGLFLMIFSGFGMLARLELDGMPAWIIAKLVIWIIIAAALMAPYRVPKLGKVFMFTIPALTGLATYIALYKPF